MTQHPFSSAAEENYYRLFERYAPMVFRYAMKAFRGDSNRAHDIVQQVFFAVWQQYDRDFDNRFDGRDEQLIMRIASRRVKDSWRQSDRTAILAGDYVDTLVPIFARPADTSSPEEQMLDGDDLEHFKQVVLEHLTETEYRVALMSWDEQLPDSEIAEVLGCTVSTVQSHRSRARGKIQSMVDRGEHRIAFDHPHRDSGGEVSA